MTAEQQFGPPPAVACPECAQQPGEWCATWDGHVGGMKEHPGLVHAERAMAAGFVASVDAGAGGGAVHVASVEMIADAAEGLV